MRLFSMKFVIIFCFSIYSILEIKAIVSPFDKDVIAVETIAERFKCPTGFVRTEELETSFGNYLRNLPLKPKGSYVKYYDGTFKTKKNVYAAVVDLHIGSKDLHQCADAVMRLRAEYLFKQKNFDQIHFNFTNGFRVDYSKWKQGNRISVFGNKTSWVKKSQPSTSAASFWDYLEQIFQYAGTASLEKELIKSNKANLKIGDVFIKGGFPGHAVIVVDKAINNKNEVVFLLAQSYMPAQEIQVLTNPNDPNISPWFSTDFGSELITPEWTFTSNQLKRWP
jgi:hypothetical protein